MRLRSSSRKVPIIRLVTIVTPGVRTFGPEGTVDEVLVDRPGRGYGDDYSPWSVDPAAPVGELVRVRAVGVEDDGILGAA